MNDINSQVTPLTRGLIWFTKGDISPDNPYYKSVDYLLDGLLTSSLESNKDFSSMAIIGKNFHHPFYVLIAKKWVPAEFDSYLSLVQKDLLGENSIVVIDESEMITTLQQKAPKNISSKLIVLS